VKFFEVAARSDHAGYWPEEHAGEVDDLRIPKPYRGVESVVSEYLGDPPSKPRKHGSFHRSAYSGFLSEAVVDLFAEASRGRLLSSKTQIIGRDSEQFLQFWTTNFVDCLDIERTVASESRVAGKLGVIKRPEFDESRWDGSELFVVPQDPSYCLFCSEEFVSRWKKTRKTGIVFRRFLMDPEPVRC
jgi:hypothetical protein